MKAICMFNNKGGVGKTTLTCNIGSLLALDYELRVLIIDSDPQCNSTQLILGEEECAAAYFDAKQPRSFRTVLDIVKPILDGDAGIDGTVPRIDRSTNRFDVDLLPGHPKFSMLEDILSEAWGNVRGGNLGGIRKTNWFYAYCETLRDNYDLVLVDVGPSLGSINRSILLGADGFAAPMGSDVFSLIGVRNVSEWLSMWTSAYERGFDALRTDRADQLGQFNLRAAPGVSKGFFGYTMQQYIAKTVAGERRPTEAYEKIISKVPSEIEATLGDFWPAGLGAEAMKLGDVPNMYSLVPMAQTAGAPIHDLKSSDGIRGAAYTQQAKYVEQLRTLAVGLATNAGVLESA